MVRIADEGALNRRPVHITVTTYRRVERLPELVARIFAQLDDLDRPARVSIVDNDPERSAEHFAENARVGYVHVARPGIGAARQGALAASRDGELLVMIDDDVEPQNHWLIELVRAWETYGATVVVGYVEYVWPDAHGAWFEAGGFMRRTRRPTGTPMTALATGSVLIDPAETRRLGVDFDPRLGLAGGEDTLFGQDLLRAGGSIIACAESMALDTVPVDRATIPFVRRRTIAHGSGLVTMRIASASGVRAARMRASEAVGAVLRMILFGAEHLIGRLAGHLHHDAVGKRRFWFAVGRWRGAIGRPISEYSRS